MVPVAATARSSSLVLATASAPATRCGMTTSRSARPSARAAAASTGVLTTLAARLSTMFLEHRNHKIPKGGGAWEFLFLFILWWTFCINGGVIPGVVDMNSFELESVERKRKLPWLMLCCNPPSKLPSDCISKGAPIAVPIRASWYKFPTLAQGCISPHVKTRQVEALVTRRDEGGLKSRHHGAPQDRSAPHRQVRSCSCATLLGLIMRL